MLYTTFLKCNSPVRIIVSHRCINIEPTWQFGIYFHRIFLFQCFCKVFLCPLAIDDYNIIQRFGTFHSIDTQFTSNGTFCENIHIVCIRTTLVCYFLDNSYSFGIINDICSLYNEFFWIHLELSKSCWFYAL